MRIFFIVLLVLVSGCAVTNSGPDRGPFSLDCPSLKEGRGVTIAFVPYAPPPEVREGEPFRIGLKFANHFEDGKSVDVFVQDSVDVAGFPPEGLSESLMVDGALIDRGTWVAPGCKLFEEGGLGEFSAGDFVYDFAESKGFGDTVTFQGVLRYDADSEVFFDLCIVNPALFGTQGCPLTEGFSGSQLGWENDRAPVTVTSVEKMLVGDKDGVTLHLLIGLRNEGGGMIGGDGSFDFLLNHDVGTFTCFSEQAELDGSEELRLKLNTKREASVTCRTKLTPDRLQKHMFSVQLSYPYEYRFASAQMKLIPAPIHS